MVHSCVTPAVTFMIPYAPLNGVSLSWCSLFGRLMKRHDLRLIKAEFIIKEIHFNLQGERGRKKKTAGRNLCWGHCWHAVIYKAGIRGLLWGFAMTAHGAGRARTCSKAPCNVFFPRATRQTHSLFPSFRITENNVPALICSCIWHSWSLWWAVLQLKREEEVASLGVLSFPPGCAKRKVSDANHLWRTHMRAWAVLSLRHGWATAGHQRASSGNRNPHLLFPPLLRKWEAKFVFNWSKPSFHMCSHFWRA